MLSVPSGVTLLYGPLGTGEQGSCPALAPAFDQMRDSQYGRSLGPTKYPSSKNSHASATSHWSSFHSDQARSFAGKPIQPLNPLGSVTPSTISWDALSVASWRSCVGPPS